MTDNKQRTTSHYVHRLNYTNQERLVGIFVLAAIGILIALLIISGTSFHMFESKLQYSTYMKNAEGVNKDTIVRISGIEVGTVKDITLSDDNRFEVTLVIYERFARLVRTDSKASLSKLAFIGDSYIEISPGSAEKPLLVDGAIIETEETLPLDQIVANLRPTLTSVSNALDKLANIIKTLPNDSLSTTFENLADTTKHLKQVSQQIADGKGALGTLVFNKSVDQNLNKSVSELASSLEKLDAVMNNLTTITEDTRVAAEKLPNLINNINETASIVNKEAQQLPELATRTRELLKNTQNVVDAVSHTWPFSSKIDNKKQNNLLLEALPNND